MSRTRGGYRRWSYRSLAILLGLLPLVVAEAGLRIAGWSPPRETPAVPASFPSRPLFVLNETRDRYAIPASRQPYFKPDSFAARKPTNGFRIFCLGGSTVQGNPYSIETAFTTWLRLSLQAAAPDREWEVVNCGGISYASYRLEPILRECLQYEPDLFVLYVGDNEFLEHHSLASSPTASEWLQPCFDLVGKLQLVHWARSRWQRSIVAPKANADRNAHPAPSPLPNEVEAILDYEGGLKTYHRDPAWRRAVHRQFQLAFTAMVEQAQNAGVPVIVLDPVANIKDSPPFKAELDPGASRVEQEQVARLLDEAQGLLAGSEPQIERLEEARRMDPEHAAVLYQLGRAYLAAQRHEEALSTLLQAKDADVCPLRLTEPLRETMLAVARDRSVPIVPVFAEFCRRSPQGIPGDEWLLDHVHPNITGHQLIADLLLAELVRQGRVAPRAGWEAVRREAYRDHLATLDAPYYARGKEHLEGLRRWAAGRVTQRRSAP